MTKYTHELPKHPTAGYTLAALTDADARMQYTTDTFTLTRSWHCACATPQYDTYARGGIAFSEFCCACGKPSANTLEDVVREAKDAACRCPEGYTVLGVHAEDIATWVRYRAPEGYEVSYHAGDAPPHGDHAIGRR